MSCQHKSSVGERIFEFASQHLYGGRRVDVLLNKLGLTYRKGKSEADLQKARQLSYKRNINPNLLVDEYAHRLETILISK